MSSPENVRRQMEGLRGKLLDLTMRNRMLNYRSSRRVGLEIQGEDSFHLHKLLVEDGKKMTFVGRPDPPKQKSPSRGPITSEDPVTMAKLRDDAEDELNAFLVNPVVPVDQLDTKLNTEEFESALQAKLRVMQREAQVANEELGINTLFLTLGMLEWSEGEERTYRAPLLFVPVALESQANGTIRLVHDGNDVGTNLPLRAKLRELNLQLPELDDEGGVLAYLDAVEGTIRSRNDWQVHRNAVCVGFFNYEKYAMYIDLGGEAWPEGRKPWDNNDLAAMFGGGYASVDSSLNDQTFLDTVRPVADCHEVFDADGSQTIAMLRAAEGMSIVVEGPPGTGKSQTITNIIAEAVAAGKSVLFVSAKRAALEVVKRKLTEADLGPICLDLHDKMTNRREFYAEIKRTVGRSVAVPDEEAKVARLTEVRDRLNAHSSAVNEPLLEFGCTPFEAMARLAGLPPESADDRGGRIDFEKLRHWRLAELQTVIPLVDALQVRLEKTGIPVEHPFWGAEIDSLDPGKKLDLVEDLGLARTKLDLAQAAWDEAARALCVNLTPSVENAQVLRVCAERALAAPPLDGIAVKASTWRQDEPTVRRVIAALETRIARRTKFAAFVPEATWNSNLADIERAYVESGSKWFRIALGTFRDAQRRLTALLTPGAPSDPAGRIPILTAIREAQEAEATVGAGEEVMRRLFGAQWQFLESDPAVLSRLFSWVSELHDEVKGGTIPTGLLDFFAGNHADPNLLALVGKAEEEAGAAVDAYCVVAGLLAFPTDSARQDSFDVLAQRLLDWENGLPRLPEYIAYLEARRQLRARGLEPVVDLADRWPRASERLRDSLLRSYLSGVVRAAMQSRPDLKNFERGGHEAAIQEFRTLDDFKLGYNRALVRLRHHRALPTFDNAVGNLQILKLQCELQRRHKPIRWTMERAGEAIQRIKPVFMMSPLSVAIHLPPAMPLFDMVIFDEASQIRPEDALCAIARAKQCIVVGDTRQMPPTSFFDRLGDDDEVAEDEADSELGQEARKLESVLSLMSAVVMGRTRRPDLRWHYRSVHPSLIQPSNEMFYDNRLIVFPSPGEHEGGRRIGMSFHYGTDSVYEGGAKSRVNRREAALVADKVLEHMRQRSDESLLVAAMNKPQAELIFEEVAKRERADPSVFAAYRAKHPHEPFDVKNLETVQGDERDVVFISVTYGRDAEGILRQQFGPLLQDGGERRLNVLFTRARRRCEVFSALRADDIRADAERIGVLTLKRYLKFAEAGVLDVAVSTGGGHESPFDQEVAATLRERGFEVHPQIGSEGFRIDLGVVDPAQPGRYVLGIECDGATYHSARSARDRDKLRQRVLENRGWRLHRIWSHDWWQDREGEIHRLIEAIESAPEVEEPPEPISTVIHEGERAADKPSLPYLAAPSPSEPLRDTALLAHLIEVVKAEGPIHRDLLFIRARDAAGLQSARAGTRTRLDAVIDSVLPHVAVCEDAICISLEAEVEPRDWSSLPAAEKKTEFVTRVELAAAIRKVVAESFGISSELAPREAFRVLGFRRVSEAAAARATSVLAAMIETGELVDKDGTLRNGIRALGR